jgi:signal transduction histidine kinase
LQTLLHEGPSVDQHTAATLITQNIDSQLRQMDLAIGFWLVAVMVFSAYLLAGITLRPVKRAMERQKRFMINISHELRTPLSVMKTTTESTLLGGNTLTRDELIRTKQSDLQEIDRMTNIIEFLLNFSNLENRMSRLAFADVDLSEAVKRAIDLVSARARAKNINIVLASEPASVSGNATAIEEVALNLIKNAIAYTPPGGTVRVTVERRYGAPMLCVEDNGVGIPEKDLPNIFEAFYRGENAAREGSDNSSGLGLAIVREVVLLHDAKLSVKSELGKGTAITIRFPSNFSRWITPWS